MRSRLLLESVLMCALIGGALFLAMGSVQSMPFVERILITVSDFITRTSLSLIDSFRSVVALSVLGFAVIMMVPRGTFSRILR